MMHVYLVLYKVALKETPKHAVINTEIFKAHLARSDSRSKVSLGGTTLVETLKKGYWLINLPGDGFLINDVIRKGHVFRSTEDWKTGFIQLNDLRLGEFRLDQRDYMK